MSPDRSRFNSQPPPDDSTYPTPLQPPRPTWPGVKASIAPSVPESFPERKMPTQRPENRTIENPSPALITITERKRRRRKIEPRTRSSASGRIERSFLNLSSKADRKIWYREPDLSRHSITRTAGVMNRESGADIDLANHSNSLAGQAPTVSAFF